MKKHVAVLTGAGISQESGLNTFRDNNGLWDQYPIEDVATPEAWERNPQLVTDFYNMRRKNVLQAKPNTAHKLIAQLEVYYNVTILTQNIDDLHERAGSNNVVHLHGEILKMQSDKNPKIIQPIYQDIQLTQQAPDGGKWRPKVVWFGEAVPLYKKAIEITSEVDYFIVVGTSLSVAPVSTIIHYAKKAKERFYLDPKASANISLQNHIPFNCIDKIATLGMKDIFETLKCYVI